MTTGPRVRVYKDSAGEWRFTYWKSSDRVATSNDGYRNRAHAIRMATETYPDAVLEVVDYDEPGAE